MIEKPLRELGFTIILQNFEKRSREKEQEKGARGREERTKM